MPEAPRRSRNTWSLTRWAVVWLLLAAMISPAAYSALTQTQFISIEGRSMAPTYEVDDLVIEAAPSPSDFTPGHVVTVRSSDGSLYTHRIVSVNDGQATLKGDGNTSPDPRSVPFDDVVGAVVGHIGQPWATPMTLLLQWPVRIFVALIIIGLVILPLGTTRTPASEDAAPLDAISAEGDAPAQGGDEDDAPLERDGLERLPNSPVSAHATVASSNQEHS